jgi:hypothetical protein
VTPRTGLDTGENKEMLPLPESDTTSSVIHRLCLLNYANPLKQMKVKKKSSYQTACSQFYNNLETFVSESLA